MRVDLPSGGWADLREVKEIPERMRRPIARKVSQLSKDALNTLAEMARRDVLKERDPEELAKLDIRFDDKDLTLLAEANDYCIVALVTAWSFPTPIDSETVLDLSGPDYDTLRQETAPAAGSLFVDFSMSKESVQDPSSPFGHSNGSNGSSRAARRKTKSSRPRSGANTAS